MQDYAHKVDGDVIAIPVHQVLKSTDKGKWVSKGVWTTHWYPRAVAWDLFLYLAAKFEVVIPDQKPAQQKDHLRVFGD